jgi:hypothetical protein
MRLDDPRRPHPERLRELDAERPGRLEVRSRLESVAERGKSMLHGDFEDGQRSVFGRGRLAALPIVTPVEIIACEHSSYLRSTTRRVGAASAVSSAPGAEDGKGDGSLGDTHATGSRQERTATQAKCIAAGPTSVRDSRWWAAFSRRRRRATTASRRRN